MNSDEDLLIQVYKTFIGEEHSLIMAALSNRGHYIFAL